jgi:hypothetical protein
MFTWCLVSAVVGAGPRSDLVGPQPVPPGRIGAGAVFAFVHTARLLPAQGRGVHPAGVGVIGAVCLAYTTSGSAPYREERSAALSRLCHG